MSDIAFMKEALEEAKRGDRPYGAVIVRDGVVLARAHNTVKSDVDPSAHAEVNAIRAACRTISSQSLDGSTLYTTGEPCAMCIGATIWAGIERVVFAASIEQLASVGQRQIAIPSEDVAHTAFRAIEIEGGLMADEVLSLFETPSRD